MTTREVSAGALKATSTGGSVNVDGVIDGNTGRVDLTASHDVNVNQTVLNLRSGASFNAAAGQNINIDAPIDGIGGAAGGAVHLWPAATST